VTASVQAVTAMPSLSIVSVMVMFCSVNIGIQSAMNHREFNVGLGDVLDLANESQAPA
jgi:hypothetical protein